MVETGRARRGSVPVPPRRHPQPGANINLESRPRDQKQRCNDRYNVNPDGLEHKEQSSDRRQRIRAEVQQRIRAHRDAPRTTQPGSTLQREVQTSQRRATADPSSPISKRRIGVVGAESGTDSTGNRVLPRRSVAPQPAPIMDMEAGTRGHATAHTRHGGTGPGTTALYQNPSASTNPDRPPEPDPTPRPRVRDAVTTPPRTDVEPEPEPEPRPRAITDVRQTTDRDQNQPGDLRR